MKLCFEQRLLILVQIFTCENYQVLPQVKYSLNSLSFIQLEICLPVSHLSL